jgi:hypothetical protein
MKNNAIIAFGWAATSLLAINAVAESGIPTGEYATVSTGFESSCGTVRIEKLGNAYPGLSIQFLSSDNTSTLEFPSLGELPPKAGWTSRKIEEHSEGTSTICFSEVDEVPASDPSGDGGLTQSSDVCYDSQTHIVNITLPNSGDTCSYQPIGR